MVAQLFREVVHWLGDPKPFTKHEELDQRVAGELAPERGHVLSFRPAFRTMAGETGFHLFRGRSGERRKGDGDKPDRDNACSAGTSQGATRSVAHADVLRTVGQTVHCAV